MLGTRPVNTARMRDDPTTVIGRYDILPMLPMLPIADSAVHIPLDDSPVYK